MNLKRFESLRRYASFYIIIGFNIILFLPFVLSFPGFISDDFLIYKKVIDNGSIPIILNPREVFYLFLRPISFFTFWMDYQIWGYNSLMMKIVSFALHLALIISFYKLLKEVSDFLKIKENRFVLLLIVLLFSSYPANYYWIVWLSNRTELLVALFYCLSFLFYFKFLNQDYDKSKYLILSFTFFCLSILSKQQSYHIPFILIILNYLFKERIIFSKRRWINKLIILEILILVPLIFLNLFSQSADASLFISSLWKKPFAIIGSLLFIINPYFGEYLYTFFLFHKGAVIFLAVLIFILISIFYLRYRKKFQFRDVIAVAVLILVSYFPRFFTVTGGRINTIQVIIFVVILFILRDKLKRNIYYIVVVLLLTTNILTTILFFNVEKRVQKYHKELIEELSSVADQNTYILAKYDLNLNKVAVSYELYFIRNGKFGQEEINSSPIAYFDINGFEFIHKKRRISYQRNNNFIKITTIDDKVVLWDQNFYQSSKVVVKDKVKDKSGRGYSEIKFIIPEKFRNSKMIYYNGERWIVL